MHAKRAAHCHIDFLPLRNALLAHILDVTSALAFRCVSHLPAAAAGAQATGRPCVKGLAEHVQRQLAERRRREDWRSNAQPQLAERRRRGQEKTWRSNAQRQLAERRRQGQEKVGGGATLNASYVDGRGAKLSYVMTGRVDMASLTLACMLPLRLSRLVCLSLTLPACLCLPLFFLSL